VGELLPGVRLAPGLDSARLGSALGRANPRGLLRLGLEPALLDLLLLEGQDVLHGLFLSARGYDLLLTSRLGRLLPPHFVDLVLELRLLPLGLLELERIADLLGRALLGAEFRRSRPMLPQRLR